jgi:hypothetical protein
MKTQQIFAVAALLSVAPALSCSKESTEDKRDQFVGTYSAALNVTTTGNTVLVSDTMPVTVTKSGAESFAAQVGFSIQSFAVSMDISIDTVFWHHAAGKSSVFKISEQPVKVSGANGGTIKGMPLGSTGYHGGFGYDNVGVQQLRLKATGSLTPIPNMVIPITVTISGTIK